MRIEETNKRVVAEYVAAFNIRNYEKLRTLFARNAIIYGVLGKGDFDAVRPIWAELHSGLGSQLHVEEMVAEGDIVAVRYSERGRFHGPFRGHAPTVKPCFGLSKARLSNTALTIAGVNSFEDNP